MDKKSYRKGYWSGKFNYGDGSLPAEWKKMILVADSEFWNHDFVDIDVDIVIKSRLMLKGWNRPYVSQLYDHSCFLLNVWDACYLGYNINFVIQ